MSAPYQFYDIPNPCSITHFFQECCQSKNLRAIKKFHAHLLRTGLLFFTPNLQTKLVFTYTTCLSRNDHHKFLTNLLNFVNPRNPLPFNSIISNFSQNGTHSLALRTLSFMHSRNVQIDSYALCSAVTSSAFVKDVNFGKLIHSHAEKSGWLSSVFVGCALVDLYAKLLHINDAAMLFDEIPFKNTVCVNALLSGYADSKMWVEGLELIKKMPKLHLDCDNLTLSAALRACTGLCAIELGRQVHAHVVRKVHDLGGDVFLQSLLIEMYGKCGLIEKAREVFSMEGFRRIGERKRDVVLWTSMLGVYGRNGNSEEVIRLFRDMMTENIRPDGVAFLTVIAACSHTGQVDLGVEYFERMTREHSLEPTLEHYSCLVDLLCRAGELERAWKVINEIPYKENGGCTVSIWGSLLSACSECGNIDLGKLAAQRALELDPQNSGIYVLLSNMYAKNSMWEEIEQLRETMNGSGLRKDIGSSWIDGVS